MFLFYFSSFWNSECIFIPFINDLFICTVLFIVLFSFSLYLSPNLQRSIIWFRCCLCAPCPRVKLTTSRGSKTPLCGKSFSGKSDLAFWRYQCIKWQCGKGRSSHSSPRLYRASCGVSAHCFSIRRTILLFWFTVIALIASCPAVAGSCFQWSSKTTDRHI